MFRYLCLLLTIIFWITLCPALDNFSENPAGIAQRTYWEIFIPGFNFNLDFDNNLLQLDNLRIFDQERYENGYVMTENDKKILTADDFKLKSNFGMTILSIGYRNFHFTFASHNFAETKAFDKEYLKLVFYGNEVNEVYDLHAAEGSVAYSFLKSSISYGYNRPLVLADYLGSVAWLDDFLTLPLTVGVKLNFYTPLYLAELAESSQKFGSMTDSLFYSYRSLVYYSDEDSRSVLTAGLGWGLRWQLPAGQIDFSLDDIFAGLNFRNLAAGEYEGVYVDSLLFFHNDDYDPLDESSENDSLRQSRRRINLHPSLLLGFEHRLFRDFNLFAMYRNCAYDYPRGWAWGINTTLYNILSLQAAIGKSESYYFQFKTGLDTSHFGFTAGITSYHGFFRYARGLGCEISSYVKF